MKNHTIHRFLDILSACKQKGRVMISVAAADDPCVLEAVKMAEDLQIAEAILVGDAAKIKPLAIEAGLQHCQVIHEPSDKRSARKAVEIVRKGQADLLMKGQINSSDFLKAILDGDFGLKTDALLSHLAVFEMPDSERLLFLTDGGMNISPDLDQKKIILLNAIKALQSIGIDNPNVAILSANEKVSRAMPSSVDAHALAKMRARGEIPGGIIEGPVALDVAICPESAEHKGIKSEISGKVDLFLVPNIETGNVLGKSLIYFGKAIMAGVILGAAAPIVLTSRAETAEGKLYSLALASLLVKNKQEGE